MNSLRQRSQFDRHLMAVLVSTSDCVHRTWIHDVGGVKEEDADADADTEGWWIVRVAMFNPPSPSPSSSQRSVVYLIKG